MQYSVYVNVRFLACLRMETIRKETRGGLYENNRFILKPAQSFAKGTIARDFKVTFTPLNGHISLLRTDISLYKFIAWLWIKKIDRTVAIYFNLFIQKYVLSMWYNIVINSSLKNIFFFLIFLNLILIFYLIYCFY